MVIDGNKRFKQASILAMPLHEVYEALYHLVRGEKYIGKRFTYSADDYCDLYKAMSKKELEAINQLTTPILR